jgi:acyl-CoA synthetase (AMP-forming)/AMP-acid ligase II/thioesterase domain-containing protein/WD40 repeat protein
MTDFIDGFQEQVRKTPGAVAVIENGKTYTYAELNERINQTADLLKKRGIKANDTIGTLIPRSSEMLVLMLAAWKCQAGFVLLDHKAVGKDKSVEHLVSKTDIKLLVTDLDADIGYDGPRISTEAAKYLDGFSKENPAREPCEKYHAYYMGTSGTTGLPKIVHIAHTSKDGSGLNGAFRSISEVMELGEGDVELWDCPVTFDPIVAGVGSCLGSGAALYIPTEEELKDPELLYANCKKHKVNVMVKTPSSFPELMEHQDTLSEIENFKLISTGAAFLPEHMEQLSRFCDFFGNGYGPTEGPIGVTMTRSYRGEAVHIGKAMYGRDYKIVRVQGDQVIEVPLGQTGELIFKSEGFEGYLGDEKETSEYEVSHQGETWYRSGDLCAFEVEGDKAKLDRYGSPTLKIFGRAKDDQVKIESVRIEPLGYEYVLNKHPDVQMAYTFAINQNRPDTNILTFVKRRPGCSVSVDELQLHLRHHNSRVMRHQVVILDEDDDFDKHQNSNKKINFKSLQARYAARYKPEHHDEELMQALLELCRHVLGYSELTAEMDIDDLGANSFDKQTIKFRILEDPFFKIQNVTSKMMTAFEHDPTVNNLVGLIQQRQRVESCVKKYHMDRQAAPLFIVSNVEVDSDKYTTEQPVVVIDYTYLTVPEIVDIICQNQSKDLYFCVFNNPEIQELVETELSKVRKRKKICSMEDTVSAEDISREYSQYVKARVEAILANHESTISHQVLTRGWQSLQATLLQSGFQAEHLPLLFQSSTAIHVHGIKTPYQLRKILNDPSMKAWENKRCVFHIEPSLFFKDEFSRLISDADGIEWIARDDEYADAWYQDYIDRYMPQASRDEKARAYERVIEQAKQIQARSHGQPITVKRANFTWESHQTTDPDPLFDRQQKENDLLVGAQPLQIEEIDEGQGHRVTYLGPDSFPQNPYETEADRRNAHFKSEFDKLVTKYHREGYLEPLFLLPPITGEEAYNNLADVLPSNRPVYSLCHPRHANLEYPFGSLEELALFYAERITAVYPAGPINIAGWSFGGLLANAIAHALQREGREVTFLAVIDTPGPKFQKSLLENAAAHRALLTQRFQWLIDTYKIPETDSLMSRLRKAPLDGMQAVNAIWEALVSHVAHYRASDDKLQTIIQICWQNYRFSLQATSESLLDNAYLVRARKKSPYYEVVEDAQLGWDSKDVTVVDVEGATHFSVTQDPLQVSQFVPSLGPLHVVSEQHVGMLLDQAVLAAIRRSSMSIRAKLPENPVAIHDKSKLTSCVDSVVIVGESGMGKSVLAYQLYLDHAESYLEDPDGERTPLFFSFADYATWDEYLHDLGISREQCQQLFQSCSVVLFIDGLDEPDTENAMQVLKDVHDLNATDLTLVATCKSGYYRNVVELNHYAQSQFNATTHELANLTNEMAMQLIERLRQDMDPAENDWLMDYIKMKLSQSQVLSIRYINQIAEHLLDVAREKGFEIRHYSMTELFHMRRKKQHEKFKYTGVNLTIFFRRLALSLFGGDDAMTHLLEQDRHDKDYLVEVLQLQETGKGLAFSHRSEQEFFMAHCVGSVLAHGIEHAPEWFNRINLAYEHEVLAYISDSFHQTLSAHDETYSLKVQRCLHAFIHSAYNRPANKIAAANAMSILAACQGANMQFPDRLGGIYFGDMNLANACLDGLDFTGVKGDQSVILDGATVVDTLLPLHWQAQVAVSETRDPIVSKLGYDAQSQVMVERRQPVSGLGSSAIYSCETLSHGEGPNSVYRAPALTTRPGNEISSVPAQVIYHQDGRHVAVVSLYTDTAFINEHPPLRRGPAISWEGKSFHRMQIFCDGVPVDVQNSTEQWVRFLANVWKQRAKAKARGGTRHDLSTWGGISRHGIAYMHNGLGYLIPEDYPFRLGYMAFHPAELVLFAFYRVRSFLNEVVHSLYVFDPQRGSPTVVKGINSRTHQFVFNKLLSFLIHDNTEGLCVRNTAYPYDVAFTVPFGELIYDDLLLPGMCQRGVDIKYLVQCERSPYVLVYLEYTALPSEGITKTRRLCVFDLQHRKMIAAKNFNRDIANATMSPFAEQIAYCERNYICLWDFKKDTQRVVYQLRAPSVSKREDVELSFDHECLLVYDMQKSKLVTRIYLSMSDPKVALNSAHDGPIESMIMHPFQPVLVTISHRVLSIWDSQTLQMIHSARYDNDAQSPCFSTCGQYLFFAVKLRIHIIYLTDIRQGSVIESSFLPDRDQLAELDAKMRGAAFPGFKSTVYEEYDQTRDDIMIHSLVVDPRNSSWLICATLGYTGENIYYCHWRDQKFIRTQIPHATGMMHANRHAQIITMGRYRMGGWLSSHIYLSNGALIKELDADELLPSAKGKYIVSFNLNEHQILLLNSNGETLYEIDVIGVDEVGNYLYLEFCFSPCEKYLAIADCDSSVFIWDIENKKLINSIMLPAGHATALAWSRSYQFNESKLYAGTQTGALFIYDMSCLDQRLRLVKAKSALLAHVYDRRGGKHTQTLFTALKAEEVVNSAITTGIDVALAMTST